MHTIHTLCTLFVAHTVHTPESITYIMCSPAHTMHTGRFVSVQWHDLGQVLARTDVAICHPMMSMFTSGLSLSWKETYPCVSMVTSWERPRAGCCVQCTSFWSKVGWAMSRVSRPCPLRILFSSSLIGLSHVWQACGFAFQARGASFPPSSPGDWLLSRCPSYGEPGRSLFGYDLEMMDGFPSSQRRGLFPATSYTFWMAPSAIIKKTVLNMSRDVHALQHSQKLWMVKELLSMK